MTWGYVAGAAVGAAASLYGSSKASSAAKKGGDQAAATNLAMYNQTRNDQAPYRYVGNQALNVLGMTEGLSPYDSSVVDNNVPPSSVDQSKLIPATGMFNQAGTQIMVDPTTGWSYVIGRKGSNKGIATPTGERIPAYTPKPVAAAKGTGVGTMDYFNASPDYQFRMQQGLQGVDRSAAARGMLLSGAQTKAVQAYGSGLAANEFGNWWNRMSGLAGIGETATNATGQAGQGYAANIGNAQMAAADARASGYASTANTLNSLGNNLAYAGLNYNRGYGTPKNPPYAPTLSNGGLNPQDPSIW
jgi:hypothetical protein